ncbi:MAG: hypothetical protein WAU11_10980 [Ignavibacteriaceae bacterium]
MDIPKCPKHNLQMTVKTAHRGKYAGKKFWGCPTWKHTKCNIIYPFTTEQEIEYKKPSNPYKGLNNFQKLKLWWNKSYNIYGTSYNGAAQRFRWTRRTTNGTEVIWAIIVLFIIVTYIISKDTGNAVLGTFICLPLFFLIVSKIINGIKNLFGK